MQATSHPAVEQVNLLHQKLMQAQISFDLWEGLREARSCPDTVKVMQPYAGFFVGTEYALFDSFVVLSYSIFETRKDSVNMSILLKSVSSKIKDTELTAFKDEVKSLKPAWLKLGILRNEVVGHQSLGQTSFQSFQKAAVTPEEIREYLSKSQELLGQISSKAFRNALAFNIHSKPRLVKLLTELRSNNSSKRTREKPRAA